MPRLTIKELEKRMQPEHIKTAYLLAENDFLPKNERRKMEDIAEELGVSRTTLYKYRNNADVIRLQSMLSERKLDQFRTKADNALMRLIDDGSDRLPSTKALQLYYQLLGRLVERKVVTADEDTLQPRISQEEIDHELEELNRMLED